MSKFEQMSGFYSNENCDVSAHSNYGENVHQAHGHEATPSVHGAKETGKNAKMQGILPAVTKR